MNEEIRVGYIYSSVSDAYTNLLKNRKNTFHLDLCSSQQIWDQVKKTIDLSVYDIIFLDGGNYPKNYSNTLLKKEQ